MGSGSSKEVYTKKFETYLDSSIDIVNTTMQSCSQMINQNQQIEIVGVKGDVNITNLDMTQFGSLSMKCVSEKSDSTGLLAQQLQAKAQQAISDILADIKEKNGALTQTDNDVVTKTVLDLSTRILNSYEQSCASAISNSQMITIHDVGGNVNIDTVNMAQVSTAVTACIQKIADSAAGQIEDLYKDSPPPIPPPTPECKYNPWSDWGECINGSQSRSAALSEGGITCQKVKRDTQKCDTSISTTSWIIIGGIAAVAVLVIIGLYLFFRK